MGKIIKPLAVVAAIAVNFIPGVGQVLSLTLISAITTAGVGAALSLASSAMMKTPKASQAQDGRLYATIDPDTPRKMVFGRTAMATDIRYQEYTGADQEYLHMIVCVASHCVDAIEELWLEDKLVWTPGGVAASHSGYLTVTPVLEGSAANTVAISTNWGPSRRLTGCAYLHLRFKLTGNSKKAESPFAGGVPNRMTIVGKGALLYDPRRDSSVGGSGTMRADNQSTWAWAPGGVEIGRNPALEELWYLLGWRINGKLAVGRGTPPARINMASFITAANACDETVAKAAGGTEPRYRADGVFSESDAPGLVFENLTAACNGVLRDVGGRLGLTVIANDLGAPIASFTADHILGGFNWDQTPSLEESFNIVRGRYTDPSPNALYQPVDYPAVKMTSIDGLDRPRSVDLLMVQSPSQAQRLVKQALQRSLYQGTFTADFNAAGWRVQLGDVVRLSFPALGFFNKLFRVIEHTIKPDGVCPMTLREENAAIYAWDAEEAPAVIAAAPITYDPLNDPLIAAALLTDGATKNRLFKQMQDPANDPANAVVNGDIWTDISVAPIVSKLRIGGSWQTSANLVTEGLHIGVANAATKNRTFRQNTDPASNPANAVVNGDLWGDTTTSPVVTKIRQGGTWQIVANYVTEGSQIGVENGANVTETRTSANTAAVGGTIAATVESGATRSIQGFDSAGFLVSGRNNLDQIGDSSTYVRSTGAERVKLTGVETGATVGAQFGNFKKPGGGFYLKEEVDNSDQLYSLVKGAKPPTYATSGQNKIPNPSGPTIVGWALAPFYNTSNAVLSAPSPVWSNGFMLHKTTENANDQASVWTTAIPVIPGKGYSFRATTDSNDHRGGELYIRVHHGTGVDSAGFLTGYAANGSTNTVDILANLSQIGVAIRTGAYTAPAGTTYIALSFISFVGAPIRFFFKEVELVQISDFGTDVGGAFKPANNADVTINQPVVSKLNPVTGKSRSSLFLHTSAMAGIKKTTTARPTATLAGDDTATISIGAFTMAVPGEFGEESRSYAAVTIPGKAPATDYTLYTIDSDFVGGARTIYATTDGADLNQAGAALVGSVVTPTAGSTAPTAGTTYPSTGTGTGGRHQVP